MGDEQRPPAETPAFDGTWMQEPLLAPPYWIRPFPTDPNLRLERLPDASLRAAIVPFSLGSDDVHDSHKFLAVSARRWPIPARGAVTVSAAISARTPGVRPGHVVPASGRRLLAAQQAAATLHLTDLADTGVVFDWFVGETTAFALYERLYVPGVTIETGYTQIVREVPLPTTAAHRFGIAYRRRPGEDDVVEWLLDGQVVAHVGGIGVPLDRQAARPARDVTYPSRGPGELLSGRVQSLEVGVGLFSLLGEYPFDRELGAPVSIPIGQRLFGQGVDARFGPVSVVVDPEPHVDEILEESFPASDPPTWTGLHA